MRNEGVSIGVVFVHPGCNMSCNFCVTDDALTTMRFDQALRLLDFMKARAIDNLVLGGGEPFAWKHNIVDLAREAKQRGFFVQAGTNGTRLPEDYERLACIDRYVLPLDSADGRIHNRLRHYGGGHHAVVLGRLQRLKESKKSVTVSTVVTRENAADLPELGAFLADYRAAGGNVHAWHLYKFIPRGRGGGKNAEALSITEAAYHAACGAAKRMNPPFHVYKRRDMYHSKSVDFFWYQDDEIQVGSEVWG